MVLTSQLDVHRFDSKNPFIIKITPENNFFPWKINIRTTLSKSSSRRIYEKHIFIGEDANKYATN
jgi:hypothetical protein